MIRRDCTPYQSRLWDHYDALTQARISARAMNSHGLPCAEYHARLDRLERALLGLLQRSHAH